ncbi:hypothetical protein CU086_00750 [Candidatus Nasuia deltocephalinicola]|uniref:Uncharacterized protein n=1 Tax=Candidatus Nasuia deltocephalincola TaxID=1160784 RepID=A0A974WKN4_9PROT|nr:hypothetical protein CU086_00750 [Candidatus Nasuia deltocephalinicola]
MYYTINKLIKNNNKIFKIIIILIWKGKHIKDISVLIKNILKLNKKIKINYFNNIGNFKNFKNIISKLIKK